MGDYVMVPREQLKTWQRCALRWKIDGIGIEIMDVLNKPAQQHQGKPVAWLVNGPDHRNAYIQDPMDWAQGYEVVPLYTHADHGEVERLRAELAGTIAESQRRRDCCADLIEERNTLRAQLAERDALLRDAHEELVSRDSPVAKRITAAISASAEPVDRLRAELAETTAVLRELIHVMYLGSPLPDWSFGESSLMTRLRAALGRQP